MRRIILDLDRRRLDLLLSHPGPLLAADGTREAPDARGILLQRCRGGPSGLIPKMPMAKSRRAIKKARTSARKPARAAKQQGRAKRGRPARPPARRATSSAKPVSIKKTAAKPERAALPQEVAPAPIVAVRKPTYHEAVALYERGLQALQRRDFAASANALRTVIERYPDERELLERARLYLKVCERELEPKEPAPKTASEWVYAATVALNAGDESTALRHLQSALSADSRHDHAHYMMAVATARRNDTTGALDHLRQAISLNPENRSLARQDPELDSLRGEPGFKSATEAAPVERVSVRPAPAPARLRSKSRR
jgi:tetratricopeptide (TPR) repeat protein